MKRFAMTALVVALSAAAISASAADPGYGNGYPSSNDSRYDNGRYGSTGTRSDFAQVISARRIADPYASYQHEECWNEQTNNYDNGYYRDGSGRFYRDDGHGNINGAVIGALVGGALGNQVGKGDGRTAATIGGAVVGAAVGNNIDNNHDRYNDGYDHYSDNSGVIRRCRMVNDNGNRRNWNGYEVTYRYAGQVYHANTNYNPGRSMRVLVDVRPQDDRGGYRR